MLCRNSTGGDGVTKIKVVHSNGSIILDKTAIGALKNWGFRPETFTAVRVPITVSESMIVSA